jgi:hypothetical protein
MRFWLMVGGFIIGWWVRVAFLHAQQRTNHGLHPSQWSPLVDMHMSPLGDTSVPFSGHFHTQAGQPARLPEE